MKILLLAFSMTLSTVTIAGAVADKCGSLLLTATDLSMKYGIAAKQYQALVASGIDPFKADDVLNGPMVKFDYGVNQFKACVMEAGGVESYRELNTVGKRCWSLGDEVLASGQRYGVAFENHQSSIQAYQYAYQLKMLLENQMAKTNRCLRDLEAKD